MQSYGHDLTQGNVPRLLLRFSLPFLLSNFVQALYTTADMIIVGWFSGSAGIAGVSVGGQVTMLVTQLVVGLSAGGTVLVAQYMGAKREEELQKTIGTLFSMLIILALTLTLLMLIFSGALLRAINTPPEAFAEAQAYVNICMLGTVFISGYNAIAGMLRGMGDSKRPLYFVTIACALNVVLDLWFVGGLHYGAGGAALATIISQGASLILSIFYLKRSQFPFDFKLKNFTIVKEKLKFILQLGTPTAAQGMLTGLSFLVMASINNSFGVNATAAVGIVSRLNGFAIMPAGAMSAAVSSMVGQNIGAGRHDRAMHTLKTGAAIAFGIGFVTFVLAQLFPSMFLGIFTKDDGVIAAGISYLRSFSFDYLAVPFAFCFVGLINGSGHTQFSMVNSVATSILVRVPLAWLLGINFTMGLSGVGLAAPLASVLGALASLVFIMSGRWKKNKLGIIPNQVVAIE